MVGDHIKLYKPPKLKVVGSSTFWGQPMGKEPGWLIVISAPSGCGKTTIVERLLDRNKDWKRSISYTTRSPRAGEVHGRDYFFISQQEFESKKKARFFLESAEVFGHSYGTSKQFVLDEVVRGSCVILAIDVQGMKQLVAEKRRDIPIVSVFIMPPSLEELRTRLEKRRTETKTAGRGRLRVAEQEIAARGLYDIQVVNQKIDQAVDEIERKIKWQCR